jgi:exodeoxyribonuclease-1
MSLVFYTTQSTGTDVFFDQILRFAAIRMDAELRETDRFEIRSRVLPHVIPAPRAMCLSGLTVSELADQRAPSHYEMVREIRRKLAAWSPCVFVGWNSLELHEGLLRLALYKTLHHPYLTNTNGNQRSDAMRMAQACSIFMPSALALPPVGEGGTRFELAPICSGNGFKVEVSRNVMREIEGIISLCQRMMTFAPEIWSAFMRFSNKAAVVDYITGEQVFCLSDFFYGKPYSYIVTAIGQNPGNNAEWYVYDLSVDPQSLRNCSEEELVSRLGQSPKPVRRLKSNGAPMIFPADAAPATCRGRAYRLEELERRAILLSDDPALRDRLISAFESLKEKYSPSPYVERQIYGSFVDADDARLMDAFHTTAWPGRCAIVEEFQDERLKTIGRQLIHLECPSVLDPGRRRELDSAAAKRVLGNGEDVPWLTLPKALKQLDEMIPTASGAEVAALREYRQHLGECYKHARRLN